LLRTSLVFCLFRGLLSASFASSRAVASIQISNASDGGWLRVGWGRVGRSGWEQKTTAVPMIKLENEYLEAREPDGAECPLPPSHWFARFGVCTVGFSKSKTQKAAVG
jgi:hypothetical protein